MGLFSFQVSAFLLATLQLQWIDSLHFFCWMNATSTSGGDTPHAPSSLAWCNPGFWLASSYRLSSEQAAAADTVLHTVISLHMRCCIHLRRLRSVRSRGRRLSRFLSGRRLALDVVRDLTTILLRIHRDRRLSVPPKSTDDFDGVFESIECCVISLTCDLVNQQTKLVRLMWFGNYLQTKLCRDQK